jgi:large subunit ribosomal protein L18
MITNDKSVGRMRRKMRVRKKVFGEPERPRLTVFRSLGHLYAQIVDDLAGKTLVSASTKSKELSGKLKSGGNVAAAKLVGELLGQKAKAANVSAVSFDRNGYRYHGRVKALADAARAAGLKF